jgi:hypothetical protein
VLYRELVSLDPTTVRGAIVSLVAVWRAASGLESQRSSFQFRSACTGCCLRPGGKIAFTVWCAPPAANRRLCYHITLGAIAQCGDPNVELPPGPPFFHYSDAGNAAAHLTAAGFEVSDSIHVVILPACLHACRKLLLLLLLLLFLLFCFSSIVYPLQSSSQVNQQTPPHHSPRQTDRRVCREGLVRPLALLPRARLRRQRPASFEYTLVFLRGRY